MRLFSKVCISSVVGFLVILFFNFLNKIIPVAVQAEQSVRQLENSNYNYIEMQATSSIFQYSPIIASILFIIFNLILFKKELKK